ncbi:MAG TPA: hypothetical protein VK524_18830 [Polyangiaceae bacterium]|nr:hypothetical protein [Polyangiaceae bacterium]
MSDLIERGILAASCLLAGCLVACPARETTAPARDAPAVPARACTQIGCVEGLHVSLQPTEGWPAGAYRFELESEAGKAKCEGALPLPACGTPALRCAGIPVQIGESGCALPAPAHGFADLTFRSAPKQLRIRISRDDQLLVARELRPQYRRAEPNGPGCSPVCNSANEKLVVF